MRFHHVGIAVLDIEQSIILYNRLGYASSSIIVDPIQKVKLCFLDKENSPILELVTAISEDSPVSSILKKGGPTPYHTCYVVENLEESIKTLKTERFIQLGKPVPAVAFDDRMICFLYHKNVGLIELLSSQK